MVERSIASFVVIMTLTAYVDEAWQVFALRAVQEIFAGYGSLTLTMAAQSAPARPHGSGDWDGSDRAAAQARARSGHRRGRRGSRRPASGLSVTASFYVVALLLVFFVYRDVDAPDPRARRSSGRISFRDILAFENFLLLMSVVFTVQFGSDLRPGAAAFLAELDPGLSASRSPCSLDCCSRCLRALARLAIRSRRG